MNKLSQRHEYNINNNKNNNDINTTSTTIIITTATGNYQEIKKNKEINGILTIRLSGN
jgi:hypothetical protein